MNQLYKWKDAPLANWTGGTTSELFIYPENSSYASRTCKFRISSATILEEESQFTVLPSYLRLIATLEGNLTIQHEGEKSIHLVPFQPYYFEGGWNTTSTGKVRDFNIIYTPDLILNFEFIQGKQTGRIENTADFTFIFWLSAHEDYAQYDLLRVNTNFELPENVNVFLFSLTNKIK